MSKLTERVDEIRNNLSSLKVPDDLKFRVIDSIDEAVRLEKDITARIHIEQMMSYVEWIISLPWDDRTEDNLDLVHAKQVLDKNHYGLEPVKDRILEYLAVIKLNQDRWSEEATHDISNIDPSKKENIKTHSILARRAPILCLVGLVGTGKTTLAKSIAQAMGRRYVRIPFGGMSSALDLKGQSRVRPDAEIGQVLKGIKFAGSKNPVILLDEVDRVAEHTRGDIMGVLVELLDPEQNMAFTDHFIDYPFDLSEVLFVATANNTTHIATAVLDRMEPIQMPSYTDEEKIKIARDYVLPELMHESGLKKENLTVSEDVWPRLVRPLGFDSGIRSLERTLNSLCRKVARSIVEGRGDKYFINFDNIKEFIQMY